MTKEERKKYNQEYYKNNKEKFKEYNKQYRTEHSQSKYNQEYYKNNKEKIKEYNKRYQSKIKNHYGLYKIYRLIYDEKVIYVGLTKLTLKKRKGCNNYTLPKDIYKASKIELIEETADKGRERFWIDYYISIGVELMNKRRGDFSSKKEAYKNHLLESKLKYKSKKTFKPKTNEEIKEIRRNYYKQNKEKINAIRREKYKTGDNWYQRKKNSQSN
jgi:hypothetical protein